jgi:hypothetical protein
MANIRYVSAIALVILAASCAPLPAYRQSAMLQPGATADEGKAVVIFAADIRELTALRDLSQVGDVYFRKVDDTYRTRAQNDYDFGIRGSVGADWGALTGSKDENKAPRVFAIEPGTYVIEKINIGSNATTAGPGYDLETNAVRIGSFAVRAGEVVNLGRLVVHMYWHEGYFALDVADDSAEVRGLVSAALEPKLQTRLLQVAPRTAFAIGAARSL